MGYESKIIMGITAGREHIPGEGVYVEIVGMVNLSKAGADAVGDYLSTCRGAAVERIEAGALPFAAYVRDGDHMESTDPYGDPLAPLDVDAFIAALERDNVGYRRFALALLTMRGWRDALPLFSNEYETPVLLHYGY